jgi:hypothetical protein
MKGEPQAEACGSLFILESVFRPEDYNLQEAPVFPVREVHGPMRKPDFLFDSFLCS